MLCQFLWIVNGQEPARYDRVSIDIVPKFPCSHHYTSRGSVISPFIALALAVVAEER